MKVKTNKTVAIVTVYAIAMAFLETVIVIYLRKLYYPQGFIFPLKGFIDHQILSIEWIRELFTLIMLACVGILAGRSKYEKGAYFIHSFAIWDIFYYVWLKVILNWPSSLLTWDLLFLIPWAWVGPVLAPLICSVTMLVLAYIIISREDQGKNNAFKKKEWFFFILGSILILSTFLYDYGKILFKEHFITNLSTLLQNQEFQALIRNYTPTTYPWIIFILGEFLLILGITSIARRKD